MSGHYNHVVADSSLIACYACDLVQRLPPLAYGEAARCPRCETELWRPREDSLSRTLALALAAAVFYLVANSLPMMGLTAVGHQASTTAFGGCRQLWHDGEPLVAALVFFAAILAPALQIGLMLAIVLGARAERVPMWVGTLLRRHPTARTWSMNEVMLLGVMVALIKIGELATVTIGTALLVLGALVLVLTWMQTTFDPREVWSRIPWVEPSR